MSPLGYPNPSSAETIPSPWQDKLADQCRKLGLPIPVYRLASDRRGFRIPWSAEVEIPNILLAFARMWYDGDHINNAKEDAAEVAFIKLMALVHAESLKSARRTYSLPGNYYRPN